MDLPLFQGNTIYSSKTKNTVHIYKYPPEFRYHLYLIKYISELYHLHKKYIYIFILQSFPLVNANSLLYDQFNAKILRFFTIKMKKN